MRLFNNYQLTFKGNQGIKTDKKMPVQRVQAEHRGMGTRSLQTVVQGAEGLGAAAQCIHPMMQKCNAAIAWCVPSGCRLQLL